MRVQVFNPPVWQWIDSERMGKRMSYSHDIIIEAWTPTAGHIPEDGADSLGNYSGYELLDEAAASIVVSPNYVPGTELVLKLHEATASVIKAHKWQASVKLNGGTAQVFTEQFTAGASGDVMTYWSIAISASGHIHTVAVAGNDVVEITLSRVAATSNEDPNIIRLYAVSVGEALADVLIGGCAGRVGKLVDRVLRQSKESRGTFFTTANIVAMINECLTDLAMEGAWPKSVDVDVVAGQAEYDPMALASDFSALSALVWVETERGLDSVTASDLQRLKRKPRVYGFSPYQWCPTVYHQGGDKVEIWPVPQTALTGGLRLDYYSNPDELGCTENFTPPLPVVYDDVFHYYCMREYWDMDSGSKSGMLAYQKFSQLYERSKADVISRDYGEISVRPG